MQTNIEKEDTKNTPVRRTKDNDDRQWMMDDDFKINSTKVINNMLISQILI